MAADVALNAFAGAGAGELLKFGLTLIKKTLEFKSTREDVRSTVETLRPFLEDMKRLNNELDRPKEEVETVMRELEACEKRVRQYSKISWYKTPSLSFFQHKLQKADTSLRRAVSLQLPVQAARDQKETLSQLRLILDILNEKLGPSPQLSGLCGAPENPAFTVGLDEPLNKLRTELVKNSDGVSVLVLTGLPGCGKTTLAKKLCWDQLVTDKFKKQILFVTLSKTPDVKAIVKTLFQHCGIAAPLEFQSDEDAINRFGILLKKFGESPILLVLDDVWPGSESLVESFKFQLPGYKILVTSRVGLPSLGTPFPLKPLGHADAMTLFRHIISQNGSSSNTSIEHLIPKVVSGCKGSPLALKWIGGRLRGRPIEFWQKMAKESQGQPNLVSDTDWLNFFKDCLDVLEDKPNIKECFMDLGLFPEDQRISVDALIDMWTELHKLDEDGIGAMTNVHELTNGNFADLVKRKVAAEEDNYYNNHFIMQHDLLRELAICESNEGPFDQRKRLIIEINGDKRPNWWPEQNEQGITARMLSFPIRFIGKQQQVLARTLSISTDQMFTPDWCNILPAEAEVLILNLRSNKYNLPEFMKKMNKLKVLIVTNYGVHPCELINFMLLSSLYSLKRMRLQQVSVPSLCKLKNLQKLSLYMCNTSQAFENSTIQISDALPNLVELSVDYCKDLLKFPAGFCHINPLKKLSITNCRRLSELPEDIGNLVNLTILRVTFCADLVEIPASIGRLHELSFLDISYCSSLKELPEEIGDLRNLQKLCMSGCSSLELPISVGKLEDLKGVICDEETARFWELLNLRNLMIEVPKVDANLNWLPGVHS